MSTKAKIIKNFHLIRSHTNFQFDKCWIYILNPPSCQIAREKCNQSKWYNIMMMNDEGYELWMMINYIIRELSVRASLEIIAWITLIQFVCVYTVQRTSVKHTQKTHDLICNLFVRFWFSNKAIYIIIKIILHTHTRNEQDERFWKCARIRVYISYL